MTLQQLKEIALKATQIEFQTHHDNSTVSVKWCSPEIILALVNAAEALKLTTEYGDIHGAPSRHATKTLAALDKAMGGEK